MKAAKLSAVYIPLVLFCSTLAVAIVLWRGGNMSLEGLMSLATLSAFVTYAVGIFEPVQILAEDLAEFISLQASIERVTGLLDTGRTCATPRPCARSTATPSIPNVGTGSPSGAISSSGT